MTHLGSRTPIHKRQRQRARTRGECTGPRTRRRHANWAALGEGIFVRLLEMTSGVARVREVR